MLIHCRRTININITSNLFLFLFLELMAADVKFFFLCDFHLKAKILSWITSSVACFSWNGRFNLFLIQCLQNLSKFAFSVCYSHNKMVFHEKRNQDLMHKSFISMQPLYQIYRNKVHISILSHRTSKIWMPKDVHLIELVIFSTSPRCIIKWNCLCLFFTTNT